jgi:hypothetical protein
MSALLDLGAGRCVVSGLELARELVAAGVPVVVCTPSAKPDKEFDYPPSWQTITAAESARMLNRYRPGVDALLMIGGNGVDVVDVDTKDGAKLTDLPPFRRYGMHRTPTGGYHLLVPSTGIAKISPFAAHGKHIGDYCGGTRDGGGRLGAFLPGSTRPKYPGRNYTVEEPLDLAALLDSNPDDDLVSILIAAGGTTVGTPGKAAVADEEVQQFLTDHALLTKPCTYGRNAVAGGLGGGHRTPR